MMLTSQHGARQLVDGALDSSGRRALAHYAETWQELVLIRQKLELLGGSRRELERELEMVSFQADEITQAGFQPGDDFDLARRADRLRNAEDLALGLASVLESLGDEGAAAELSSASAELAKMARLDPSLIAARDRLEELSAGLAELQLDLAARAVDLEHEPGELDKLELRIADLGKLKRKYGESLDEVLAFAAGVAARAAEIAELLGTADELADDLAVAEERTRKAGERLTGERSKTAISIAGIAVRHLQELGMSDPAVEFEIAPAEPGPMGADRIELRFASDAALAPGAANKVASGGELSRLTLALRLAAGIDDASLLAFDEVDAGIGGAIALAMGEKLSALSKGRQLFCVTHLPQVAAFADTHYVVERDGSRASVHRIDGAERLEELSRMLGGLADSERGQLHAAELLEAAQKDR
jgi:DNA repair protein RecN (Recombination protein N)